MGKKPGIMTTYDFTAYTYFAIKAETYEEACDLAEKWVEENVSITDGFYVDFDFVEERSGE